MPNNFLSRLLPALIACLLLPLPARAQWVQSRRANGIAYFLLGIPSRIERLNTTNGEWLPPIVLPTANGPATTMAADADTLYVAYGKSVKRYNLEGGAEVPMVEAEEPIQDIFTDGDLVLLHHSTDTLTTLRKSDNTRIDHFGYVGYGSVGASIAPNANRIFGRTGRYTSPSGMTYVQYKDDGTFAANGNSLYYGSSPFATRTWVFPGQTKVVDDAGTVASAGNLLYLGSLGDGITDLDFYGTDIPIVLRGSRLQAYTSTLLPAGSCSLPTSPQAIYVAGKNVLAFTAAPNKPHGIRVDVIPLANLEPPEPNQPIDPRGLAFTPESSFVDRNGIVFLLSKVHQNLFRWDSSSQAFLSNIPLLDSPDFVAYSASNHTVYTAYTSGLIRQINLGSSNLQETPFALLPKRPVGLATADSYVFAAGYGDREGTQYTYDSNGVLADSQRWDYDVPEYIWSPVRQKMYMLRAPEDLRWEEINANGKAYPTPPGTIGGTLAVSLFGNNLGYLHPTRVAPDGSVVVLGSGAIHDATTLERLPSSLANRVGDMAWLNGGLCTIRSIGEAVHLQRWAPPNYWQDQGRQLPGQAHRLMALDDRRLVAITLVNGVPSLNVLDANFNIVAPATLAPPEQLSAIVDSASHISLSWRDGSGEESYVIESRSGGNGWGPIGTVTADITAFADVHGYPGGQYSYRIVARNGAQVSPPSAELVVTLAPPPPVVPFVISNPTSSTAIALYWIGVEGAAKYVVERKLAPQEWGVAATVPGNVTYLTDPGLIADTAYAYRVKAVNSEATEGAYSPTTLSLTWSQLEEWLSVMNAGRSPSPCPLPLGEGTAGDAHD